MLEDKTRAMLESANVKIKEMADTLGIDKSACYYWLAHGGKMPAFYAFCKLCGYKIQLRSRANPKEIIRITQKDIDEDEKEQLLKRHTEEYFTNKLPKKR